MLFMRFVLSDLKCLWFVLRIQMPFILPLNYTKCSVGRAAVHQLQKNRLIEKERHLEVGQDILVARPLLYGTICYIL